MTTDRTMSADGATGLARLCAISWKGQTADDLFASPFVDVDEWRDTPVPHRYVHGGFEGTDTLFSYYFPSEDAYEGRFFQHVTPVPQSENLAPTVVGAHNKIAFAVDSGAYFVETNGGGPHAANPLSGLDSTIGAFRANAAAARFSRKVAGHVYEREHRPFGYLYGGSGGAYRTMGASENTTDVWDGFVPYVPGSPMSIPSVFSVRMHAQRVLRDVLPAIVAAYDVGGDPSSLQLTADEAAALSEATRMGFPPRSWFGWETMGMHAFSVLFPAVMAADPTYAEEFWNAEGYLGADPTSSVHRDRVQVDTSITELLAAAPADGLETNAGGVDESFLHAASVGQTVSAIRLACAPAGPFLGAELVVRSGTLAGEVIRLSAVRGDVATLEAGQDAIIAGLAAGDGVTLDNSRFLAVQTYHRHQVPGAEYTVWDQFRDTDGAPLYPQRPTLLGPMFTERTAGALPTGRITGKVIVVACLLDREAFPWQADWYRSRVAEYLGDESGERFRLWYIDNALHGDADRQEFPDRSVDYVGALEAALRQLAAWVERGISPSPDSEYQVIDGQIVLHEGGQDAGGIQPVASLTLNGSTSAEVSAGHPVCIRLDVKAPTPGVVVEVVSDIFAARQTAEPIAIEPAPAITIEQERAFHTPGTYFLSARVTAQMEGEASSSHARVQNIVRARLTVTE